jgi:hypothetical protein
MFIPTLFSHLHLDLKRDLFFYDFLLKMLYALLAAPCYSNPILVDSTALILDEEYTL